MLRPDTYGLREALEALTSAIPDPHPLFNVIEGTLNKGELLAGSARVVAPWIAQEMLRWLADPELAGRMPLEQYATLLAGGAWPPPPFTDEVVYFYQSLPTTQSESIADLREMAARTT
jgi:hypothetical protein